MTEAPGRRQGDPSQWNMAVAGAKGTAVGVVGRGWIPRSRCKDFNLGIWKSGRMLLTETRKASSRNFGAERSQEFSLRHIQIKYPWHLSTFSLLFDLQEELPYFYTHSHTHVLMHICAVFYHPDSRRESFDFWRSHSPAEWIHSRRSGWNGSISLNIEVSKSSSLSEGWAGMPWTLSSIS